MFVEIVRLLMVAFGTMAGFTIGRGLESRGVELGATDLQSLGGVVGCLVGYVSGGILGRLLERGLGMVERSTERLPATKLFSGAAGAVFGGLLGAMIGLPGPLFLEPAVGLPLLALCVWVSSWIGMNIGMHKAEELFAMAGLSTRPLIRSTPYATGDGYVVDTSAVMDGQLLPLARAGLIEGDLLVPLFVLDELQSLADAADGARSRRAKRGLEILDLLRTDGSARVSVIDDEVPGFAEVDAKLVALAKRLQTRLLTTDGNMARVAEVQGVATCNLRQLAYELWPARMPGDVVHVDLVRKGNEEGQGVGYLDDGSMVVVSEAAELVGGGVDVMVTSTIPTAVGRMVFAKLA